MFCIEIFYVTGSDARAVSERVRHRIGELEVWDFDADGRKMVV